jgi:peptidoglycan/xylan/chitin deacetylase (PgdA/CDA1 family)
MPQFSQGNPMRRPESRWYSTPLIRASIALHLLALLAVITTPAWWPWVLAAVAGNHLLIAAAGLWPRSNWLGPNWTQLPAAAAARNEIALTIDDGPDPLVTPQVLDLLDRYGIQATFFCVGEKAAQHPELCRDIVRRGHAVENHSQHHRHHFSIMGLGGIMRELQAAQRTLTNITGLQPLFFRAPAGLRNPFLEPVLAQLGLQLATWSVRGFDTRVNDARRVTSKLLQALQPGVIMLLHDGNAARTAAGTPVILEVLPVVLEAAAAAGLRPVTLREALA